MNRELVSADIANFKFFKGYKKGELYVPTRES